MATPARIYESVAVGVDEPLCQGEILSTVKVHELDLSSLTDETATFNPTIHPFAVIMTQWCDLVWDYKARQGETSEDKKLPAVLFCQVQTAEELRTDKVRVVKTDVWNRIKLNKEERYQFLEKVPAECDAKGEGLPELAIDFKRYFTLPTEEVYHFLRNGGSLRRTKLVSPYLEHLCSRFAYFLSRIGLPEDHRSE